MTTFLWHDYETFGLSPSMDRPAQFAAIRTDERLEKIGSSVCLYCKPAMDSLPSPQSILITGILPQFCEKNGLIEAEFAHRIFSEMSRPDTISVGYNNMRFDDEVSRFMFWRNFIDPYEREYKDGCSRFDLFPLVVATWALRPEGIEWPTVATDDGSVRPSFRLEHLSVANGLAHEHAHDALSDVQATIEVAKLIARVQPKLWEYALRNRSKEAIRKILMTNKPLVWVTPYAGHEKGYTRLVVNLGPVPGRTNDVLLWDLSEDPTELLSLTGEEVKRRLFTKTADLPNGEKRLPIYQCKINQAPFLVPHFGVLSDERAALFGIDKKLALERAAAIAPHIEKLTGLWTEAYRAHDEELSAAKTEPDVDAGLYGGGFASFSDKRMIQAVGRAKPEELTQWVREQRLHFEDPRFNELLLRYRARNWPETLDENERSHWNAFRQERLIEGKGRARTLEQFSEELAVIEEALAETATQADEELIGALYDWAEKISDSLDQ